MKVRDSRIRVCAAVLLAACGPAVASDQDLWDLPIDKLMQVEVRVPSRFEQRVLDSPTALSVYEREEIRALGARYLHELLAYVPGFQTSLDVAVAGQRHAFSARGSLEFHSPGILVLRDGRRVNDVYTRGAPLFARWISLENVVRVEVLRGPGSALYGSNAVVGVVNLVTRGLTESYGVIEAGRFGSRRAAIAYSDDLGPVRLSLDAELLSDGGQQREVFDRHGRSTSSSDPRRFEDLDLVLRRGSTFLAFHEQARGFEDFHDVGGNVGNGLNRHDARLRSLVLGHVFDPNEKLRFEATAQLTQADWDFRFLQAPDGTGPFQSGDFVLGGSLDQRIVTLAVESSAELGEAGLLSFGGEFIEGRLPRAQLVSTYDLTDPTVFFGEPRVTSLRFARDEKSRVRGIYIEHTWQATPRLSTRVGARIDDDRFGETEWSPRANLDVALGPRQRLSFLAGRAFRAPGLGELFLQNQPVILGNPDLRPTSLDTLEVGYRLVRPRLLLAVSLFGDETEDAIVSVPTQADPNVAMFQNSGTQETLGIEAELLVYPGARTVVRAGGTYLFENDTNIAATASSPAPEDFFADSFGFATVRHMIGRAEFTFGLRYRNAFDALPDQGATLLADGRIGLQASDRVRLWLRATNLLNHRYAEPASGGGLGVDGTGALRRDIPARGRAWWFGLSGRF